jgi:hypothetical protein
LQPKDEICFLIIIEGLFTEWSERQARRFGKDVSAVERKLVATATPGRGVNFHEDQLRRLSASGAPCGPYTCTIRIGRVMKRKLTITVSEAVYEGLHRMIGRRRISQFIEKLARPHVVPQDIEASYRDMAADQVREQEALEWSEGVIADSVVTGPHAAR